MCLVTFAEKPYQSSTLLPLVKHRWGAGRLPIETGPHYNLLLYQNEALVLSYIMTQKLNPNRTTVMSKW